MKQVPRAPARGAPLEVSFLFPALPAPGKLLHLFGCLEEVSFHRRSIVQVGLAVLLIFGADLGERLLVADTPCMGEDVPLADLQEIIQLGDPVFHGHEEATLCI